MSALTKLFGTNKKLESDGVEVTMPEANPDGTFPTFWITRPVRTNEAYEAVRERVMRPHRKAVEMGILPPAKLESLTRQVFGEACINKMLHVPMADVTGDDKAEGYAEDTIANRVALMDRLPELYGALVELATNRATWQQADADVGNSSRTPNTSAKAAA